MALLTPPMPRTEHPLFTSNDPPTAQEARSVRGEIAELEKQNDELSQRLISIHTQLKDNTKRLESLKWINAPVRRIPLEILGEIFLRMSTSQLRPRNYQNHIPRLSLVCKSWRDAARLTPRLWCDIWVKADARGLTFESLSAWAVRGGSLPKTLEITSSVCGPIDRSTGHLLCGRHSCLFRNRVLTKLLKHTLVTWHSVLLNCPTPHCLSWFIDTLHEIGSPIEANGWGSLQSFKMIATTWNGWVDRDEHSPSWKAFSFLPSSVTSFSLHLPIFPVGDDDPDELIIDAQLEWPLQIPISLLQGLTHFELHCDTPDIPAPTIFAALQHCENLESLEIGMSSGVFNKNDDIFILPADFLNLQGVSLPKLRRLRLHHVVGESLEDLQLITFPNLVDLFVSFGAPGLGHLILGGEAFTLNPGTSGYGECDVRALANFIYGPDRHTSPSCLQSLHLKGVTFLPGALHHIICDLGSLTCLKLEWVYMPEGAQADFSMFLEGEPTQLKKLRTLEVESLQELEEEGVQFLRLFAGTRGIELKLSFHEKEAWREDDRRYLYRAGLDPDSEDEY